MAKIERIGTKHAGNEFYQFFCPGCQGHHVYYVKWSPEALEERTKCGFSNTPPAWTFDGNLDSPTFSPSLLNTWNPPSEPDKKKVCHLFVRAGRIEFCGDCTHALAGKTVEMAEVAPQDSDANK